jgi:hypothetical protein
MNGIECLEENELDTTNINILIFAAATIIAKQ